MKITAKSFFNYYIIHPFSKKLSTPGQIIATIASTVFLVLTLGILHGRAAYLEGRRVKVHSFRSSFDAQINKMGNHILPYQRQTLLELFDRAIQSDDPWLTLNQGIDSKINQSDGWGKAKADHLKNNLLPVMRSAKVDRLKNNHLPNTRRRQINNSLKVEDIAKRPIDAQGNKLVCFYKIGPTSFLGNFAKTPGGVHLWNHNFECSEAAYQWRKYNLARINDPKMQEFFRADGERAFELNRYFEKKYPNQFAPGWIKGGRDRAMWEVLQAKFSQQKGFRDLLNRTKGAYLLEHNQAPRDNYWSDNHNGSGKNMLGKMLMALRDGLPQPPMNDTEDTDKIRYFANYANRSLDYSIFSLAKQSRIKE